ncbi:DNA-processing protein DprA [uncultured Cohaesibacter sp.]|uniref:DNA-processing protein DprA n=1 Tax=uncultured Cohaesibacter sp. TaxID=1002546 RepID=UPI00292E65EA|nr:DNA-processing protein DprA [uncultured Cohaesibacter sp.]
MTTNSSHDDPLFPEKSLKLTDEQRFHWLRLIRCENVGPATFRDLINHFGSAEKSVDALPDLSRKGGARKSFHVPSIAETEREWNALHQAGAYLVAMGEPDYPKFLNHIPGRPPLLTMVGDASLASKPSVAIVGSRNCSASGAKLTGMLASDLGGQGIVIVSGLARGIDTWAHKAALGTGTVAVLAGGLNHLYPKENIELAHAIAKQGLLISETPWDAPARSRDFPRRNRIISGVSSGTLVIEAAKKSGSLITANYALEQGREVFAVPGSPLDPRASGTNHLIKQGAHLVCEARDILDNLSEQPRSEPVQTSLLFENTAPAIDMQHWDEEAENRDRIRFSQCLGITPVSLDDLIRQTGLPTGQIQLMLLELDLAGRLERHTNQSVSLKA